jgi:hypothetical protein
MILDGMLAKHLIERVTTTVSNDNHYHIIFYNDNILPQVRPDNIRWLKFDPTSLSKLSQVASNDYMQVMIMMSTKSDTETVLRNLQHLKIATDITILDRWDINLEGFEKMNITAINSNNFLSNVMTLQLPNIPTTAQSIGLGTGEIMEVKIPFGSSYVYRHIHSIEQINFKIVGIYRDGQLIIASNHHVIQPNDTLLLIGEPDVLINVYKAIKNETGQFPAPFGNNIYLLLDLSIQSYDRIYALINEALFLHQNLNNIKLHIKVINPTTMDKIRAIKMVNDINVFIEFHYDDIESTELIEHDITQLNIGLIIVDDEILFTEKMIEFYHGLKIPLFKAGRLEVQYNKDLVIFLNDETNIEKISPIVFDLSTQLSFEITLLDHDPEGVNKEEIIEHFDNLSRIFSRKINLVQDSKNPIREAKQRQNFLQVLPFTPNMFKTNGYRKLISTGHDMLIYELREYPLILIP